MSNWLLGGPLPDFGLACRVLHRTSLRTMPGFAVWPLPAQRNAHGDAGSEISDSCPPGFQSSIRPESRQTPDPFYRVLQAARSHRRLSTLRPTPVRLEL